MKTDQTAVVPRSPQHRRLLTAGWLTLIAALIVVVGGTLIYFSPGANDDTGSLTGEPVEPSHDPSRHPKPLSTEFEKSATSNDSEDGAGDNVSQTSSAGDDSDQIINEGNNQQTANTQKPGTQPLVVAEVEPESSTLGTRRTLYANSDSYSVQQGTTLRISADAGVLVNDSAENEKGLSAKTMRNPLHGEVSLQSSGAFTYQHDGGNSKVDTFSYKAADLQGSSAVAQVEIAIQSANPNSGQFQSKIQAYDYGGAAERIGRNAGDILPPEATVFVRPFYFLGEMDIGFAKTLGDKLEALGLRVKRGAKTEIQGRFIRAPLEETKPVKAIRIIPEIFFADGTRQQLESVTLENRTEAQLVFHSTGEVIPQAASGLVVALDPKLLPTMKKTVSRIYPSARSPFSAEIVVNGRARRADIIDGVPTVSLSIGDEYVVKLYNEAPFDAAARIRIDGLGRFTLADESAMQQGLWDFVPARKASTTAPGTREIQGWYRNDKLVNAFVFGAYEDSVLSERLPQPPADAGTIVIGFAATVPEDASFPPGEPPRDKSVGTGRGGEVRDPTQIISRKIGVIRAIIRIRYVDKKSLIP